VIGAAFGAATLGTLAGPALGTIALAIGTRLLFAIVGACAGALLFLVLGFPQPARQGGPVSPLSVLRNRSMRIPIWANAQPALAFGLMGAVIPLRLSHLRASEGVVAAVFLAASGVGAIVSPWAGRLSDRRGRLLPIEAGLVLSCPALVLLPLLGSLVLTAILTVVFMGVLVSLVLVPSVALIMGQGERAQIGAAVPAVNLITVAVGEMLGSAGGAGLGQVAFAAAPFLLLAFLNLTAAGLLIGTEERRPEPARPLTP
jgi:predicted MFS family arabinose efflux permease